MLNEVKSIQGMIQKEIGTLFSEANIDGSLNARILYLVEQLSALQDKMMLEQLTVLERKQIEIQERLMKLENEKGQMAWDAMSMTNQVGTIQTNLDVVASQSRSLTEQVDRLTREEKQMKVQGMKDMKAVQEKMCTMDKRMDTLVTNTQSRLMKMDKTLLMEKQEIRELKVRVTFCSLENKMKLQGINLDKERKKKRRLLKTLNGLREQLKEDREDLLAYVKTS